MIKVLVVDDSGIARDVLTHLLSSDPEISVVGVAHNGEEAIQAIAKSKPDVVTMDVTMPRMDGFEATRTIMETTPVPIVIVSASFDPGDVSKAWRAVEAGAVAALAKPGYCDWDHLSGDALKLIQTVKLMSQVKLVRRWRRPGEDAAKAPAEVPTPVPAPSVPGIKIVVIGASTGGPPALQTILSRLPASFRVPICLVQHIAPGFAAGFVDWLNRTSRVKLHLARDREQMVSRNVYVAPDGVHMQVDALGRIRLTHDEPEYGLRPSASLLFRSTAEAFGDKAVGVLLTGMGRDGAEELKLMRDKGAVTIAQNKESCVVYGMPGEAMKLGAVKYSLPPDKIAEMLTQVVA